MVTKRCLFHEPRQVVTSSYLTLSYISVTLVFVADWTLSELVEECGARIRALPAPSNGQVRAVPDERTIRYYATLGLLDRPTAMRGRTALYSTRHLAQIVAIKRLQVMGRSLSEIQTLWPTLDDATLARMSGVSVAGTTANPSPASTREEFWKREPIATNVERSTPTPTPVEHAAPAVSISIELAPHISITLPMTPGVTLSQADVRALRAAAAPLLNELANRQLTRTRETSSGEEGKNV
jgi:DNA-binding transcriptional MerR regulator